MTDTKKPCKWLKVHRVFNNGTFMGNVHQCGFKLAAFNRGELDALHKFIDLMEKKGLQGVVGAQQDCPVAPEQGWTECPLYKPDE